MVKKHPTNSAGQKNYGFAYFNEWGYTTQTDHIAVFLAGFDGSGAGLATSAGSVETPLCSEGLALRHVTEPLLLGQSAIELVGNLQVQSGQSVLQLLGVVEVEMVGVGSVLFVGYKLRKWASR